MSLFGKPKGKKYHTRTVEINTYEYDEQRLAVDGYLKDHRFQEYHLETGERRQPGLMHHMTVYLLVNKKTLDIEDLHVKMPVVPDDHCREIINSMNLIKGLRITRGFTSKIKALIGGSKGCTHIVELLTQMATSTIQGQIAYIQQGPLMSKLDIIRMVENSCWPWRSDGPIIKLLKQQIEAKRKN
ncbi:MAG TPA: DUF2889 domain-containing protein [Syntrophales bacterium]|nr:DUF2889 domain-containing protein [Syntrophales bacterium]HPI57501.1 DUF2889 domain-containing protein [Syntrophales bacterium]HPN25642.1 DUF2889 domain-containing protein [Syntrophales bacterium]HQM29526.1 DUF2889 domain-containing protein [Syntrophales bacterium]